MNDRRALSTGIILCAIGGAGVHRHRSPSPFIPGIILVAVAVVAAVARGVDLTPIASVLARAWPGALVAAGVVLVVTAFRRRTA